MPGGLGVFEAIALIFLEPHLPVTQILGALVTFRGVYFLLPLMLALLILGMYEVTARSRNPRKAS